MAQKKGQAALLLWAQRATEGYPGVKVENFHTSWRDGLAFAALVHHFRPDAIEFSKLSKNNPIHNHTTAFDAAEKLGVPALLEADDMMIEPKPDQFSVMTYLSQMYHVFEKGANSGGGIANIAVASEGVSAGQAAPPKPQPTAPQNQAKSAPQPKPNLTLGISKPPPPKLGDLKSSPGMQSSVQMDVSGQNCVKCDQQLSGEVIEAVGKMYHDKCFGCKKCGKKLAAKFLPIEGWPYCDSCGRTAFISSRLGKTSGVSQPADNKPAASNNRQSVISPQKDEATMLRERREKAEEEMRLRREKDAREKKEAEEKLAKEKSEREKSERERSERLQRERLEREKEQKERESKAARDKELKDKEQKEREQKEREQKDKKDREQKEKEQKEKEQREKEQRERESKDRELKDKEQREKLAREKEAKEREAKAIQDKEIEREKENKLKKENEEKAKKESEKAKQSETTTLSFAPSKTTGSQINFQPKPLSPNSQVAHEPKTEPSKPQTFTSYAKVESKPAAGLSSTSQVKVEAKPVELQKPTTPPPQYTKPETKTGLSSGSQIKVDTKPLPVVPAANPPQKLSSTSKTFNEPVATKSSDPTKDELLKRQQKLDAEREAQEAIERKNRESTQPREQLPAQAEKVPEWMAKAREKQSRLSVMVKPEEKKDNAADEKARKDAESAREKEREEKERAKKTEQEKAERAAKEKEAQLAQDKLSREKKEKEEKEAKQQELRNKQEKEREQQELREKQHKEKEDREKREREQSEKREREREQKDKKEREQIEKRERELNENRERELNENREREQREKEQREQHERDEAEKGHHTTHDHEASARPERPMSVDPRRATVQIRSPAALMEGFLLKQQPTGFVRFWQQRYFVLKEESLSYFHEQRNADGAPSGLIYLRVIDSIAKLPNGRFTIHTSERSYALEADSDAERDLWFDTINFYRDRIETKPINSIMDTTAESSNLKKEGWLSRMGVFGFSRVWVTVRGGQLSYAEKQAAKAQGRIQLYHCKLAEYDPVKYPHSFEITPLSAAGSLSLLNLFSSSTVFQAADDEDMQKWLNAIIVQKLMIEETIDNITLI